MSNGLIGVTIVCVTVLFVVGMICWTQVQTKRTEPAKDVKEESQPEPFRPAAPPTFEYSKTTTFFEPDESVKDVQEAFEKGEKGKTERPALPIDPNNPPKTITFPPNMEYAPSCVCHGKKVQAGQEIIAWPDGNGYRFFCPET